MLYTEVVKRASGLEQISDLRFSMAAEARMGEGWPTSTIDVRLTIPVVHPKNFVTRAVMQTLRAIVGLGKNQPVS